MTYPHTGYHFLIVLLKANSEDDVYIVSLPWSGSIPSVSGTPYKKFHFSTGRKSDSNQALYVCDVKLWGGDAYTLGVAMTDFNTENWRTGVVGVTGIKFYT